MRRTIVRTLIQLVMLLTLVLGGNSVSAAAMPCCAPAQRGPAAAMRMSSAAGTERACHGAETVLDAGGRMMDMPWMAQCPSTFTVAADASKTIEQTMRQAPLKASERFPSQGHPLPPGADGFHAAFHHGTPPSGFSRTPLPLRV